MKKLIALKRGDVILVACLLVLGAAALILISILRPSGVRVVAEIDGTVVEDISLSESARIVLGSEGRQNVLVVKDGRAYIEDADCPDLVCVHHLPISKEGETIVCLPHKLVVRIVGGEPLE